MNRQAFKQRMQDLKSYREQNPGKGYWDFKQQQAPGPYSAGELVKSIEEFTKHEEYLGPPSHNYDFTLSEEWADKHGYYPDERGHKDDRVKKEAHPTHPSKGKWRSLYQFDLTDKGMEDPNFILYGLNDGGQDPQATMTYREGIVLPELTVTPKDNYIYNSYDNIKAYQPGGETGLIDDRTDHPAERPIIIEQNKQVEPYLFELSRYTSSPTVVTTVNNYGDKKHSIPVTISDEGRTIEVGLPEVVVTPKDNLDLGSSVAQGMNQFVESVNNRVGYTLPSTWIGPLFTDDDRSYMEKVTSFEGFENPLLNLGVDIAFPFGMKGGRNFVSKAANTADRYVFMPHSDSFTRGIGGKAGLEDLFESGVIRGNPIGTETTAHEFVKMTKRNRDHFNDIMKSTGVKDSDIHWYQRSLSKEEFDAIKEASKKYFQPSEAPAEGFIRLRRSAPLELYATYDDYLKAIAEDRKSLVNATSFDDSGQPLAYFYDDGRNPLTSGHSYAKSDYGVRINNASSYNPRIFTGHEHYSMPNAVSLTDPNVELFERGPLGITLKLDKRTGKPVITEELKRSVIGRRNASSERVKYYAGGGDTGDDKYNQQLSKLPQSKIGTEEKEWLRNWYQKRREYAKEHPYIANNMNQQLDAVQERFNVDPYTLDYYFEDGMKYPQRLAGYLNSVPIKIYEGNIPGEDPGLTGLYDPLAWYGDNIKLKKYRDKTTLLHELNHVLNVNNKPLLDNVRDRLGKQVMINDKYQVPFEENSRYEYYDDYLLDPAELHSRLTEFRYLNNLDPTKEYKLQDVKEWRKSAKDRELLDLLPDDNTILELINTIASTDNKESDDRVPMAKDGLQTGNDTPVIGTTTYNNYGDITHNIATSFSDDTLNLGLPDIVVTPRDNLDLAGYVNNRMNNAARFGANIMDLTTPVGDVHQLYDVVNDTRSGDYLSAGIGLAALALPFTPTGLKHVKSQFKYIPSVNKSNVAQQIDAMADKAKQGYEYMTDVANAKNRVFESLKTMPYQYRAKKADEIYGTNYSEVYDVVDQLYNHDFFKLPEVLPKRMEARARMQAKPEAVKKFSKTGEGAGPEDFQLETNTELPMDPEQLSVHELNHYMDYIISRHPDASKNNRMLREIEKSLKKTGSSYFRMGTEQKAYMNQLRQILKKDGVIQNLDEPVSEATLKKYLDSMSDENSIKKAFKQHKNIKEYTKWFNSIPLAAVTAPVVNKGRTKESEDKLI